ncbi:MAG: prolipoprotein diacylglyceryl transferase [Bdellovibrionales bacterium]|nr:prolipoprotein diacylglyceryl transferase [Bdellovibrionales bacterium]
MFPILFRIGDAALYSYPLLFSLAYFVGLFVWQSEGRRYGLKGEAQVSLSLGTIFSGLLGARLLFLLTQWRSVLGGELQVWALWEGGLVFLGGFVAGFLYLLWSMPRWKIPYAVGFDTLAPALAWAHAVGRLGCFANGCCHGRRCDLPWAVTYSNPLSVARPLGTPLHPSQLYEALGLVLLGWWLMKNNRRPSSSQRWATRHLYLMGYGVLRFAVEFTRGDVLRGEWLALSTSQWISLGLIFAAVLLDLRRRPRHNSAP